MKLWGGRFEKETHQLVEEFTASIHFDKILWEVDILGSHAHVLGLANAGILNQDEVKIIRNGLNTIAHQIKNREVEFTIADEDIHMNIERLLFKEIGELAGKLHTGRSRNDQIALDLHLYLREQLLFLIENIGQLQTCLFELAENNLDTILPGYTHMQHAQPIRFAHHLLAYAAMLQRDLDRLISSWPRLNILPLGAGAIAGSGFNLDREYVAKILYFDGVYENSMDAVSNRDHIAEFIFNSSLIMMHLSRFCEEIILWSTHEFSFIELDDAFCTGSSMMPQKKNPDVAELIRGKSGRVYGSLISLLTLLKSLPLTYNKDMQEDKEGLFDTIKTVNHSLKLFTGMIHSMKINKEIMLAKVKENFAESTAVANYLVKKEISFRQAHKLVGQLVSYCIQNKTILSELPLNKFKEISTVFDEDIYATLNPEQAIELCNVKGGTAKNRVIAQLNTVKNLFLESKNWHETTNNIITNLKAELLYSIKNEHNNKILNQNS
jgi:argininosuccinate lyase